VGERRDQGELSRDLIGWAMFTADRTTKPAVMLIPPHLLSCGTRVVPIHCQWDQQWLQTDIAYETDGD
jgi:hypothetical protein